MQLATASSLVIVGKSMVDAEEYSSQFTALLCPAVVPDLTTGGHVRTASR